MRQIVSIFETARCSEIVNVMCWTGDVDSCCL